MYKINDAIQMSFNMVNDIYMSYQMVSDIQWLKNEEIDINVRQHGK